MDQLVAGSHPLGGNEPNQLSTSTLRLEGGWVVGGFWFGGGVVVVMVVVVVVVVWPPFHLHHQSWRQLGQLEAAHLVLDGGGGGGGGLVGGGLVVVVVVENRD